MVDEVMDEVMVEVVDEMVVEFLTFDVPPDELDEWLRVERRHWTTFLAQQEGFIRKEVWRTVNRPTDIKIVIWWESMAAWSAIPQEALDAVVGAMGPHERHAECTAYDIVRTG